jgi:AcrR family transcriptional regulator
VTVENETVDPPSGGTRERLLAAALDAFSRTGFEGTSNRDIERLAGVERGLLGYHFGSKQALWDAAVDGLFARYFAELEALRGALRDVARHERARALIMAYARYNARNPELFRILVMEGHTSSCRSDRLAALMKRTMTVFSDLTDTKSAISTETAVRIFQIIGACGSLYSMSDFAERTFGTALHDPEFLDGVATSAASIAMGSVSPIDDSDGNYHSPIHFLGA